MSSSESLHSQEPPSSKPDSPKPESRLTLSELSSEVQSLAVHVSKRILALCQKHGIEMSFDLSQDNTNLSQAVSDSVEKFIEKLSSDPSLTQDAKKLLELQQLLTSIHETNRIPEEEQKQIKINANPLENPFAYVHAAAELYTSLDLPEWVPSVNTTELIEQMSLENRELVEKYRKKGWIAMYMPSRTVQMETLAKAVQKLKPLWIVDGVSQTLDETYVWDYITDMIVKKHPDLFKDVPDQPYFDLTNPTPNVHPDTVNKTVDEQKEEFARMKKVDPNLSVMGIPGFLAMETWATQINFSTVQANGETLRDLSPIDDVNNSLTRFIDLPISDNSAIPRGCFVPLADNRRVALGLSGADSHDPWHGFRLSVRVPIA